jgi:phosphate transport system permease protein
LSAEIVGTAKPRRERLIEWALATCGFLSIAVTIGILFTLASETIAFFKEVSLGEFFGGTKWTPLFSSKHFGIWPLISGTLLTAGIAILVALPLGLLAAIYLSEFASPRAREVIKPALEILAGVPTIVYGFFALIVVTPILQSLLPGVAGFNALSAGLVMGIMIVPMISSLTEDALRAVPDALREASYGLGASKPATILKVVLPAASSGIIASVLLAISRAIGETMIVAIAAGQQASLTVDPQGPVQTMTAFIVQVSMGDTPAGSLEYRTIFAVASTLFVLTFVINAVSQRIARKYRGYSG